MTILLFLFAWLIAICLVLLFFRGADERRPSHPTGDELASEAERIAAMEELQDAGVGIELSDPAWTPGSWFFDFPSARYRISPDHVWTIEQRAAAQRVGIRQQWKFSGHWQQPARTDWVFYDKPTNFRIDPAYINDGTYGK